MAQWPPPFAYLVLQQVTLGSQLKYHIIVLFVAPSSVGFEVSLHQDLPRTTQSWSDVTRGCSGDGCEPTEGVHARIAVYHLDRARTRPSVSAGIHVEVCADSLVPQIQVSVRQDHQGIGVGLEQFFHKQDRGQICYHPIVAQRLVQLSRSERVANTIEFSMNGFKPGLEFMRTLHDKPLTMAIRVLTFCPGTYHS